MKDNIGDKQAATPSTAVQMTGLNAVPTAGDDFNVAASLDEVRIPCCFLAVCIDDRPTSGSMQVIVLQSMCASCK